MELDKKRILSNTTVKNLLKKTYPNLHIKENALQYLIVLIQNIADTISMHAINYTKKDKRKTITSNDIHYAVKLSMPKKLENDSLNQGFTALTKYTAA